MLPARCSCCEFSAKMSRMLPHVRGHLAGRAAPDGEAAESLVVYIAPVPCDSDFWMLACLDRAATFGDLAEFLKKEWFERCVPDADASCIRFTMDDGAPLGAPMAAGMLEHVAVPSWLVCRTHVEHQVCVKLLETVPCSRSGPCKAGVLATTICPFKFERLPLDFPLRR